MCGIAGVVRFDGRPVAPGLLREMGEALAHRGPDDATTWHEGPVGLSHRRLSIIDVDGSQQPMQSADGSLVACFNGEVLNYRDIRRTVRYPYRTQGDTEVLLAAFQDRGPAGTELLRGQFAYAIHDRRNGSTWLFRDRLGILPLYYAKDESQLAFASEVKALFPALGGPPDVDLRALGSYLAQRAVPAPHTLFQGIRKVRPGHVLRVDAAGAVEERPYWSLAEQPVLDVDDEQAARLVREALDTAVARNLVADVPVGAYLSGGLDSSLVVALAARQRGGDPLQTFSAGFDDPRVDEVAWARQVSEHVGTRHHTVVVRPQEFQSDWPRLTRYRDAPLSEPADVAVHRLAVAARREVKVVLSGEGADELFAGYPKHRLAHLAARLDALPGSAPRAALGALADRLPARLDRVRTAGRALAARDEAERLGTWFAPFTATERRALLPAQPSLPMDQAWSAWSDPLSRQLVHDLQSWLPDNLLERGDRMSMSASLELRPPFLDLDLVELAFRLPSRVKVRGGTGKRVLRTVAAELLPAGVIERPKSGFRVPLDAWFRGDMRDFARDLLTADGSFVASVLDRSAVRRLLDRHESGRSNEQQRIWTLLSLEVWHGVTYGAARATGDTADDDLLPPSPASPRNA